MMMIEYKCTFSMVRAVKAGGKTEGQVGGAVTEDMNGLALMKERN